MDSGHGLCGFVEKTVYSSNVFSVMYLQAWTLNWLKVVEDSRPFFDWKKCIKMPQSATYRKRTLWTQDFSDVITLPDPCIFSPVLMALAYKIYHLVYFSKQLSQKCKKLQKLWKHVCPNAFVIDCCTLTSCHSSRG